MNYFLFDSSQYCREIPNVKYDRGCEAFNSVLSYLFLSNKIEPTETIFLVNRRGELSLEDFNTTASSKSLLIVERGVKSGFTEIPEYDSSPDKEKWIRVKNIENFLLGINVEAAVFQSDCCSSTLLLTSTLLTDKQKAYIAGIFPKLCPFFFPEGFKLSEENTLFIKSIASGDEKTVKNILTKTLIVLDKLKMNEYFKKYYTNRYASALENTQNEIGNLHDSIRTYESQIVEWYKQIEDLSIRVEGMLKNKSLEGLDDLLDYLEFSNIYPVETGSSRMILGFKTFLSNYENDISDPIINNIHGSIYHEIPEGKKELVQRAYVEIFIKRNYKLRVYGEFLISRNLFEIKTANGLLNENHLYNPHLYYYQCWDSSSRQITTALAKGDMLSALNQAQWAVGNISFTDSAVTSKWGRDLWAYRDSKIFVDNDGNEFSLEEICQKIS